MNETRMTGIDGDEIEVEIESTLDDQGHVVYSVFITVEKLAADGQPIDRGIVQFDPADARLFCQRMARLLDAWEKTHGRSGPSLPALTLVP